MYGKNISACEKIFSILDCICRPFTSFVEQANILTHTHKNTHTLCENAIVGNEEKKKEKEDETLFN